MAGLRRRVAPLRSLQVDARPLGLAQLSGAHEHQRRQTQGAAYRKRSRIAVQEPEQGADLLRIGDRREVLAPGGRQRPAQVPRHVPLGPSRRYRVAQHPPAGLKDAVGHPQVAAFLDAAHRGQEFRRRDFPTGFAPM